MAKRSSGGGANEEQCDPKAIKTQAQEQNPAAPFSPAELNQWLQRT